MSNNYKKLREKAIAARKSLFDEKYIDEEQLVKMERIYAGPNPENVAGTFVENIFKSFFEEGHHILHRMVHAMNSEKVNLEGIVDELTKLKNSSTCAGATKLVVATDEIIQHCNNEEKERMDELPTDLIGEYSVLKIKVIEYFDLLRLAGLVEAAMPCESLETNNVEATMPPKEPRTRPEY